MDIVELAKSLIKIPSISVPSGVTPPPLHGEAALVAFLTDWLKARGATVDITEIAAGRPNLVARFGNATAGRSLMLEAHTDTVAVEGMTIAPFDPLVRNGRLYGRGACDVKGPMAAMLAGIVQYLEAHGEPPGPLYFAALCGEELGGLGAAAFIQSQATRPDAVIVAEPTDFNVIFRHKGVARYRITTRGRAAHSSMPLQGINAINGMQPVLTCLSRYHASLAEKPGDDELGHSTLSVGTIHGGSQVNIVPDCCTIEVDHRLLPGESPEEAAQHIRSALEEEGIRLSGERNKTSFDISQGHPPLGLNPNDPLVQTVLTAVRSVMPSATASVAHYATDAGVFHAAGIPSVVFGPGSIREAHTADEFIQVTALKQGATAYARIMEAYFGHSA